MIGLKLRRWQREALDRWRPHRAGVASVVTGGGKTVFALACVQDELHREPETRVLIVVPTLALLDQWLSVLPLHGGWSSTDISAHSGRNAGRMDRRINVATVNTARTLTARLTATGRWMVVADECHRFGSPANRAALTAEWSATLGLSATPSREYDTWFEDHVEPILGPVIYEYGHREAVEDGVLVSFSLRNYRVPLTGSEALRFEELTKTIARLSNRMEPDDEERLKRASIARARVIQDASARVRAAREILSLRRGERALVFHERVQKAEELAGLLRHDGHRVVLYHSEMSQPDRLKSLLLFKSGQADVLVSCRALDEGLDVPEASFGLICSSSASSRQRIQRMGRLLRTSAKKDTAEIATIYASVGEKERLAEEEKDLEGVASVSWYEVIFA